MKRMRAERFTAVVLVAVLLALAVPRPLAASPGQEFTVQEAGVALRARPDEAAEEILSLTPDHRLVEFAREGDWVRVGVYREIGAFGWVPVEQLIAVRRPGPAAVPPEPLPEPLPEPPPFLMEVTGTPTVQITGVCTLLAPPDVERTVAIDSLIPKSYRFKAAAVDCRIRKNDFIGRMRIRLYWDDILLAGRTINGPYNQIWIRSDGPWGPARAVLRGGLVVRDRPKAIPLPAK